MAMKAPEIDFEELERRKEEILKERENFAKMYAEWLKRNDKKQGISQSP